MSAELPEEGFPGVGEAPWAASRVLGETSKAVVEGAGRQSRARGRETTVVQGSHKQFDVIKA